MRRAPSPPYGALGAARGGGFDLGFDLGLAPLDEGAAGHADFTGEWRANALAPLGSCSCLFGDVNVLVT